MNLHLPEGFLFSSGTAGIKASGRPDLALALIPKGASAAAMFTRNQMVAAPVVVGRENLRRAKGKIHALIVNSGNANCATGLLGLKAASIVCKSVASVIHAKPAQVFPSSTGIIGVLLPLDKIITALPNLIAAAQPGSNALQSFANTILTTDTRAKLASAELVHKGIKVGLVGVAKGAGMIHPNMATMLVYLFTDISAKPPELQQTLKNVVGQSFNNISIDGDTSTNDTVLLLASGQSKVQIKSVRKEFESALLNVCKSLAQQIVADGEGVKHVVRLKIEQARNIREARQIASTIATSALVKTAWAGADPNWGRIVAAIGRSGVTVNLDKITMHLGDQQIFSNGGACKFNHQRAHQYMSQPEYEIRIALGLGKSNLEFLSCDLTAEYVHINADYST
ncbi:MAG TPA: bifunctional glutamate N-acetyltransferase/amino-acid acetyltransferase ArgJ [Candidatus Angelobacter sp.]|nr:bifunctional glutamate N-acetyltransferase/amino-acid acetyltransferase ArgJ [Candidatus Angelobacter sp.]